MIEASRLLVILLFAHVLLDFWISGYFTSKTSASRTRQIACNLIMLGIYFAVFSLLLTAKSILRFNEIQNAKVRSISEYVLLGTLLSFTLSIGTGLLVMNALKLIAAQ
ncbi:hypothetical protein ACLK1G_10965 [Pseudomonas sp. NR3]|uniref:hypothetical protein n=1 Tax=Pseudomonas sp. NR3 TaxID=3155978 RepID=UPI003B67068B